MGGKSYERIHLYNQRARWHSRTSRRHAGQGGQACQSTVTIVDKNGKSVDATRLMALMGMGIKCGDTVTVKIEGCRRGHRRPRSGEVRSTSICNSGIMYGRGRRSKTAAAVLI